MRRRLIAAIVSAVALFVVPGCAFTAQAGEEVLIVEESDPGRTAGEETDATAESASPESEDAFIEVIPDEEIAKIEDAPASDEVISGESDGGTIIDAEAETEAVLPAADDFLAGIEAVETKNYAAGEDYPDSEEIVAYDTVTETLENAGLASVASQPSFSLFRIRAAVAGYTDSYGAQLSGNAKLVYDALVQACVGVCEPKDTEVELSPAISFQLDNYSSSGWDREKDAGYQSGMDQVRYEVQSAYGAFVYDYPQVFWMNSLSYGMSGSILRSNATATEYKESISKITLKLQTAQLYTGAAAETSEFNAAVDAAVDTIQTELGADASRKDTVKAIHDYLCGKSIYEENTYAHSAVGVFLKGGAVVCEGYAKAFKVLCGRFGIPSVLIVGVADEAHMWNYVKMEDDNWYLVDATWDDQSSGIRYEYFLAGSQTVGFRNKSISEERTVYTCFSELVASKNFAVPVLNGKSYQEAVHTHEWVLTESKEPTCTAKGYNLYCCSCGEETRINLQTVPHKFEYVSDGNATCQEDGTKTQICVYGCGTKGKTAIEKKSGHVYPEDAYVYNNDATCIKNGTETASCMYGCGETDTREIADSRKPHLFKTYKPNGDATCMKNGTETALCEYGCGETDTREIADSRKPHLFENYKSNGDATCTKNGTETASCEYGCGAEDTREIAGSMLGHSFVYKSDGNATCEKDGTKTQICSVCGAKGATKSDAGTKKKHVFKTYKSNGDATALRDGTKTAYCAYGCGTKKTVTDKGTKLPATVKLNVKSLTLRKGQSTSALKVSGLAKGDYVKKMEPADSGSKKLIKVTPGGKIKAQKKKGTAKLRITLASGKSVTVKVKVQSGTVKTKKIYNVPGKLTLKRGKSVKLSPKLKPVTSQQKIRYFSSNKKVVSVSSSGRLKAKKKGKATITIRSGSESVTCKVTVKK